MKNFLRQLFFRSRYVPAAVAGVLLALAFPSVGIAGCAWVAPALMLAAAWNTSGAERFRLGFVAGLGFYLTALYWLLLIPVTGYPILGWLALSAYLALYPATWLWLLEGKIGTGSWARRTLWSLAGAAIWVALEMIVSRLFSGFPWLILGNSQARLLPLIQIASVTGVYGVSFLVVWISLSLCSATVALLRQPANRHAWLGEIILPLGVVVAGFFFGMSRLRETDSDAPTCRVTLVQPSIPQTMIWDQSENTNRFRQVLELSERALTNETDLLLWPEAALPQFDEASFTAITNLVHAHRVWMILGADEVQQREPPSGKEDYDVFNSAFLFGPDGSFRSTYRKQKLVIFGEYVPLIRWLPFIKYFTPITGGFTPGTQPVPFKLERGAPARRDSASVTNRAGPELRAPIHISTLICFEDVFPHLVPEYVRMHTDFLVNLTNDGWFGEGAEQWQHAASATFRAVENGVPLVRCCNNGLTCWIDAHGVVRQFFRDARGSVYGTGAMTAQIPLLPPGEKREPTFYNRHGDWFGWSCVGVLALIGLPRLRKIVHRKTGQAVKLPAVKLPA